MKTTLRSDVEAVAPVSELWQRIVVTEPEAARMLKLPMSTWQLLKRRHCPPLIHLGKHNRLLVADLRAWLETQK